MPLTHESVESWGLRPRLPTPQFIRKQKILLLTDSGAMIYRRPPKKGTPNKVKPDRYLNNETCTEPWSNIIANYEVGGADWARWADFLQLFVTKHGALMERCPDGENRFPSCVGDRARQKWEVTKVGSHLNVTEVGYASQEASKDVEQRTMLDKFLNDMEKQSAITQLMALLNQFRSAIYCQTAPARHWDMPEVVDQIADHIRELARKSKIATLDATQFWSSSSHSWVRPNCRPLTRSIAKALVWLSLTKTSLTGITTSWETRLPFLTTGTGTYSASFATWRLA